MTWFFEHLGEVVKLSLAHLYLALVPLVVAVIIAVPLGWAAMGSKSLRGIILSLNSVLYTIPSLALFVILPVIIGTKILDPLNVIIALALYSIALLVRATVDALVSVPAEVRQAATAMGYKPLRRFLTVDLPLSVPVLIAGIRVVSVSNISLASVGAVIGVQSLGFFFTDGFLRSFITEIVVGIVATIVLALVIDVILVIIGRMLTRWQREGPASSPAQDATSETDVESAQAVAA